jgi:hypothetical protein
LIYVVLALIGVVVYIVQLSRMVGSANEQGAKFGFLYGSYYHPGVERLLTFLRHSNESLFGYLFANYKLSVWMDYFFFAGIGLILLGKGGGPTKRRLAALSIVLPLMASVAAAILGLYPHGGTRHDAYLIVFVAAGVAVTISFLALRKVTIVLLAALFLVPQWQIIAQRSYLEGDLRFQTSRQMKDALTCFYKISPRPRVLVVDQEGSSMVTYYVCHSRVEDVQYPAPNLSTYRCGDYKVLQLQAWAVQTSTLEAALAQARRLAPDQFPDPAWVFSYFPGTPITGNSYSWPLARFGRLYLGRISPSD